MKTKTILGLTTALVGLSTFAIADVAKPTGPKPMPPPPAYASLPNATFTTPPSDKAPKSIAKTEKVDGFNVADPPKNQIEPGEKITSVMIFQKPEEAKTYTAGKGFGFETEANDTVCYSQPRRRYSPDDPAETTWPLEMQETSRISAPYKPPPPPKKGDKPKPYKMTFGPMEVTAIHQERFSEVDKKATIETVDAWVDPNTHGVKLISRQTMTLERIGSAFNGIRLYAAKGDKTLHIVARRQKPKGMKTDTPPTTSKDFRLMNATSQPLQISLPNGENDFTQCGFAHITMKAAAGSAEIATFETTTVFVDPVEKKDDVPPVEDSFGSQGREDDGPTLRTRPFRATVSSTWASKDKEPQISVSFGWVGREREM